MKLKSKEIGPYRAECTKAQNGCCALCNIPFTDTDRIVLDHNHQSGMIRGAIHNGCNVVLGKIENGARRYRVDIQAFLAGVAKYQSSSHNVLHPTFKTADEKKALAKKRAARRKKI